MRVTASDTSLVVSDSPGCLWLFGAVFVASGTFVLARAMFSSDFERFKLWEEIAVLAIGIAHLAAGLWTVRTHAATRTVFVESRPMETSASPNSTAESFKGPATNASLGFVNPTPPAFGFKRSATNITSRLKCHCPRDPRARAFKADEDEPLG